MSILRKTFFLVPVVLILLSGKTTAQSSLTGYAFQLRYHYAFVMNHSVNMAHLANQRPMGVEVDVMRRTFGKKQWEQVHRYPVIGYSFLYMHMDPAKPLGDSYSAIIYYGKKFLQRRSVYLSFRFGLGAAYIEKRFDRENNYQNNLISSRINYALNGRLFFHWDFTPHWSMNLGFGLMHYSNGAMKVPNLGINLPGVHAGISFTPQPVKHFIKDAGMADSLVKKVVQLNLVLAGGLKQVYPTGGPSYFASTISFYANKIVAHRSALNIGTDLFYDASGKVLDTLQAGKSATRYFKWGLTAGHEFLIHRISLLTQLGFYLYDPLKVNKLLYQRVGLKYRICPKAFISMSLKTHFGQADYVEWGLGYKF